MVSGAWLSWRVVMNTSWTFGSFITALVSVLQPRNENCSAALRADEPVFVTRVIASTFGVLVTSGSKTERA